MDGMVTARLPLEKKQRGNEVLASLGTTPSRLIGELYDYVISEGKIPDMKCASSCEQSEAERLAAYQAFMSNTVIPMPAGFWDNKKSDEDLLTEALEEKYGSLA